MGTPQYGAPDPFALIHDELIHDATNDALRQQGMGPIYTVGAAARVAVIGQAPGRRAQASGVPWDDASGATLMQWLGSPKINSETQTTLLSCRWISTTPAPAAAGPGMRHLAETSPPDGTRHCSR